MKCQKCRGLMYTERFMDFDGGFDLWKCINCGALTDPVISKNQHLSEQLHAVATNAESENKEEHPLKKHEDRYAVPSY